ncbi:MAG: glycogen/starch/alpha-glucan phosphorylase, partial [Lachnospiraceae bacterium]|nr:glycogen/starch/alpha-glucan phosphorylase [Lachnospiraceae bacterium]
MFNDVRIYDRNKPVQAQAREDAHLLDQNSSQINSDVLKKTIKNNVRRMYRKDFDEASNQEIYQALSLAVKDIVVEDWIATQKAIHEQKPTIVYYMSMEFLMGRALGNILLTLSKYYDVKRAMDELGIDINAIEDEEPDPALGNGGLGRLAACFLDSLSTLGYAAYGCGIRY